MKDESKSLSDQTVLKLIVAPQVHGNTFAYNKLRVTPSLTDSLQAFSFKITMLITHFIRENDVTSLISYQYVRLCHYQCL